MKTKLLLLLPLSAAIAAAQPGLRAGAAAPGSPANSECPRAGSCPLNAITPASPTTLSAADLRVALDAERVAGDLYRVAAERWNLPVFANIAAAEARHASVFEQLATGAGVTLPAAQAGVYADPDTQRLYEQLLPLIAGSQSGALKAAALVEETSVSDLRRLRQQASDEPTRAVLTQLERASLQHLAAFVRHLAMAGETYQPQLLPAGEIPAARAGGMGRNGGRGYRGGR